MQASGTRGALHGWVCGQGSACGRQYPSCSVGPCGFPPSLAVGATAACPMRIRGLGLGHRRADLGQGTPRMATAPPDSTERAAVKGMHSHHLFPLGPQQQLAGLPYVDYAPPCCTPSCGGALHGSGTPVWQPPLLLLSALGGSRHALVGPCEAVPNVLLRPRSLRRCLRWWRRATG